MITLATPLPDTVDQATAGTDRGIHWLCVQIKAPPFIALCGELVEGDRRPTFDGICKKCTDLAADHGGGCPLCATWVGNL